VDLPLEDPGADDVARVVDRGGRRERPARSRHEVVQVAHPRPVFPQEGVVLVGLVDARVDLREPGIADDLTRRIDVRRAAAQATAQRAQVGDAGAIVQERAAGAPGRGILGSRSDDEAVAVDRRGAAAARERQVDDPVELGRRQDGRRAVQPVAALRAHRVAGLVDVREHVQIGVDALPPATRVHVGDLEDLPGPVVGVVQGRGEGPRAGPVRVLRGPVPGDEAVLADAPGAEVGKLVVRAAVEEVEEEGSGQGVTGDQPRVVDGVRDGSFEILEHPVRGRIHEGGGHARRDLAGADDDLPVVHVLGRDADTQIDERVGLGRGPERPDRGCDECAREKCEPTVPPPTRRPSRIHDRSPEIEPFPRPAHPACRRLRRGIT
jgi:hypothetical protein